MTPDEDIGSMDADATAYFESRGEKVPEAPQAAPPAEAPEDADTAAAAAIEGKPDPMVPLRAVTREREEKKQIRDALQEMERKYAVLTDRWDTLLKGAQPQPQAQPTAPQLPNPNEDIFKTGEWSIEKITSIEERLNKQEQDRQQEEAAREYESRVWNYWDRDVEAVKAETPEFAPAATWLAEFRDKQLQAHAAVDPRFSDPKFRTQYMNFELRGIIEQTATQGKSPAKAILEIAKGYGFKAKAAEPAPDAIADLAKNADAEISLSAANGSRQPASPDAETIANMSEAEFSKWFAKNGASGFRKVAG